MNKKWMNSALNCEVYSFEGLSSNDRIVRAKTCLSLCRNKKQSKLHIMTGPHLPIQILAINMVAVRNKYDTLQEISKIYTLNDKYKNFIPAHIDSSSRVHTNQTKSQV